MRKNNNIKNTILASHAWSYDKKKKKSFDVFVCLGTKLKVSRDDPVDWLRKCELNNFFFLK